MIDYHEYDVNYNISLSDNCYEIMINSLGDGCQDSIWWLIYENSDDNNGDILIRVR